MLCVYVNNIPVYLPQNSTVLQACEIAGQRIPRFCYHDLLEIAGNCRICLVEIEKSPKPQVSCGLPVLDNIRIYTNTPLVRKAREAVLEFLLLNHPLDCPICDQGGECDLQDQSIIYSSLRTRFKQLKRGVEDKGLGPLIKTIITRCIHCTRCVRFAWDVAGVEDLGTTLRGAHMEIGTYIPKVFNSEVSANVIDLCPVGALTSKIYAFQARPWELVCTRSIDTTDGLGSNILIETKKNKILRLLPVTNKHINQEWLSDKSRFAFDGNRYQRIRYNIFNHKGKIKAFKNTDLLYEGLELFIYSSYNFNLILGRNQDFDTLITAKVFGRNLGFDVVSESQNNIDPVFPAAYISSLRLSIVEKASSCFLMGVNPRWEATIANLRLRSRFRKGNFKVFSLGSPVNLTYKTFNCGLNSRYYINLCKGKMHKNLKNYKPLFVYGDGLIRRMDARSLLFSGFFAHNIQRVKSWFGILRLSLGANSIGKSFLGFQNWTNLTNSYLVGCEEDSSVHKLDGKKILIEATHTSSAMQKVDFVLPLQTSFERKGLYINAEGLIQESKKVTKFVANSLRILTTIIFWIYAEYYEFKEDFIKTPWTTGIGHTHLNIEETYLHPLCPGLVGFHSLSKIFSRLKLDFTPLKTLCGNIFNTSKITNASLTLSKVSTNMRLSYIQFLHLQD